MHDAEHFHWSNVTERNFSSAVILNFAQRAKIFWQSVDQFKNSFVHVSRFEEIKREKKRERERERERERMCVEKGKWFYSFNSKFPHSTLFFARRFTPSK